MYESINQNFKVINFRILFLGATVFLLTGLASCKKENHKHITLVMAEQQISFSNKNHALDNNDNFSPDDQFLCYDTRGTVFNTSIGNSKSIEKIEISTGKETVLYQPESVTGEEAAPGIGAVSWHPSADKVIFIHGPDLDQVTKHGYYGITNRTGVEVSADGNENITKVDLRDVETEKPTISGAQRGGTHRHEYSKDGNRIGYTYNDFLNENYDRTIGYMEKHSDAPAGYTHYFAVILKPAEIDKSKPGEIEKANGDAWIDKKGTMRAFIGKVRSENGIDYQNDVFIADIPESVDITTAFSGEKSSYPEPPTGIKIRRITYSGNAKGIVRGSFDGKTIAYLSPDQNGILQIFITSALDIESSTNEVRQFHQVTSLSSDASKLRWHPNKNWLFTLTDGNIAAICAEQGPHFGKTIMLTADQQTRGELVVSNDGNTLAYTLLKKGINDHENREFKQIFVLNLDWNRVLKSFK